MQTSKSTQAWMPLRATFELVPIVAGLDKFFNLLTSWDEYLGPVARALFPVDAGVLLRVVGLVEIAVGVLVLSKWTRLGAYLASAWLVLIAINLLTMGQFFDIAARDLALAASAFALARLAEARAQLNSVLHRGI